MSKCVQCAAVYMLASAAAAGARSEIERGGLGRGEYHQAVGRYEQARKTLQALGDDPGPLPLARKQQGALERALDRMFSL